MALTVPIFELFRARFRTAMAAIRDEVAYSRPGGLWDSISMTGIRGNRVMGRVRRGFLVEVTVQFIMARVVQTPPLENNCICSGDHEESVLRSLKGLCCDGGPAEAAECGLSRKVD